MRKSLFIFVSFAILSLMVYAETDYPEKHPSPQAYEGWKLDSGDKPTLYSNITRRIGRKEIGMGLIVIGVSTEISHGDPPTTRTCAAGQAELAHAFFHEVACHAGRMSGPTRQ